MPPDSFAHVEAVLQQEARRVVRALADAAAAARRSPVARQLAQAPAQLVERDVDRARARAGGELGRSRARRAPAPSVAEVLPVAPAACRRAGRWRRSCRRGSPGPSRRRTAARSRARPRSRSCTVPPSWIAIAITSMRFVDALLADRLRAEDAPVRAREQRASGGSAARPGSSRRGGRGAGRPSRSRRSPARAQRLLAGAGARRRSGRRRRTTAVALHAAEARVARRRSPRPRRGPGGWPGRPAARAGSCAGDDVAHLDRVAHRPDVRVAGAHLRRRRAMPPRSPISSPARLAPAPSPAARRCARMTRSAASRAPLATRATRARRRRAARSRRRRRPARRSTPCARRCCASGAAISGSSGGITCVSLSSDA